MAVNVVENHQSHLKKKGSTNRFKMPRFSLEGAYGGEYFTQCRPQNAYRPATFGRIVDAGELFGWPALIRNVDLGVLIGRFCHPRHVWA